MSQLKIAQISGLETALGTKVVTAANVGGSGVGIFSAKASDTLNFNKLAAGTGILTLAVVDNVITIGVDVGATANKILQLNGSGQIPAVNGSLLTNLTAANITGTRSLPLTTLDLAEGRFYVGSAGNSPTGVTKASIPLSGFGVPTANIDVGAYKITTSATSFSSNELVTKTYVDSVAQGSSPKEPVKVASVADVNIAAPGATIDGISMSMDDRVLLKNQTAGEENGVWLWKGASSAMVRAADADTSAELLWMEVFVQQGTNASTKWRLITPLPITVNTTVLDFIQTDAAIDYSAGSGLLLTGTTFSARVDDVTIGLINDKITVKSTSTAEQVLKSTGNATQAATWGALDLSVSASTTGVLAFGKGGTGMSTLAQHSIVAAITGANALHALLLSTNTVVGRKSGDISALGKADLLELLNLRQVVDSGTATQGSMTLITLSQTPGDATKVLVFVNGQKQRYSTDYTISGTNVVATNALNTQFGGSGSDGMGFSSTDLVTAVYFY